jgi:hypothetical protein
MFDLFIQGAQAWNQVGFFIGAVVCLGIGGLILGNSVYWRVHALRAQGTVIGVIANGGTYTPVYRYTLADGQSHVAKSDTGSGWVRGKETGRVVPLMISAHNPTEAREAGGYLFDLIGLVFALPGVLFGYIALTAYPVTRMTWFMAAAMLLYLGERAWRAFIPKGQRLSIEDWKKQHNIGQATLDLTNVKPIETLVSAPEAAQARLKQTQNYKVIVPILAAVAVLLLGIGVFQSMKISRLEAQGLRAEGRVVRLNSEHSSNGHGYTYYPVVRFRTQANATVEFKDSVGTNPPSHRAGDRVTVLYLPSDPQRQAIIDRGVLLNWTIPAIIFLFAAGLAMLSIVLRRQMKTSAALALGRG